MTDFELLKTFCKQTDNLFPYRITEERDENGDKSACIQIGLSYGLDFDFDKNEKLIESY